MSLYFQNTNGQWCIAFLLSREDLCYLKKAKRALLPSVKFHLQEYVESGEINITEAEILDKSQGDILSKGACDCTDGMVYTAIHDACSPGWASSHHRSSSLWLWHSRHSTLSRMDCGGRSHLACSAPTGWSWTGSQWVKWKKGHATNKAKANLAIRKKRRKKTGTKACGVHSSTSSQELAIRYISRQS